MNTKKLQPILRLLSITVIILGFYLFLRYFIQYIYPFIIAFIVASILHPIVSYVETRWNIQRTIATSFIMLLFLSSSTILFFFVLQQLGDEIATLLPMLPTMYTSVNQLLFDLGHTYLVPSYEYVQSILPGLPSTITLDLEHFTALFTDKLLQLSMTSTQKLFSSLSALIASLSQMIFIMLFVGISGFIMTKDYVLLQEYYNRKMPQKSRRWINDIHVQLKKSTFGMVKAHFLLAFLTSMIAMLCLYLFQLEHVLFLSILIFAIDLIPYIGVGTIFIPWIIFQFVTGDYQLTIQLTCLYMLIIVIRQVIEPKIIASHIGLHPLVTVILLFISINMFGLLGVFLTPMMFICISAIYHTRLIPMTWNYIMDKK